MRNIARIAAVLMFCVAGSRATEFNGKYLDNALTNPGAMTYSAGALFSSSFESKGGATMASILWHKADIHNTLMPKTLLDLGFQPVGWTLNIGLGGNSGNFMVPLGFSANLFPTTFGPCLKLMNLSSNKTIKAISSLISSDRGGVAFGPQWTAYPMVNGTIVPLNEWRFPPGWFLGAQYAFK